MRASQELRWKQRIKENEERRRRYEETSKRLELEEKEKAQQALEQRRAERARMDDLMRHPSQAPAPPKKPILRKGSGAVLRPPVKAAAGTCCSPRPATVPLQGTTAALGPRSPARAATAGAGSNQQSCMVDRQRREWADSLKQFIAGQREAGKPKQDTHLPADDGLSWQELKVAAEAGFEELLKTQEAAAMAAAAAGQQHTPAWRRPGMTRATGGGGSTAEQWAGAPGLEWAPLGTPAQLPYASTPPSVAPHPTGSSSSSSSPPVSKWAARMQQARGAAEAACSSAQDPGRSSDLQSPGIDSSIAPAAPAGPTVQLEEQQGMHAACQPETQDGMQDANEPGQPAACPADQPDAQQQLSQQADLLQEAGQQNGQHVHHSQLQDTTALAQQLQLACDGQQGCGTSGAASRALSPAGHSSTACSSPGSEVAAVGALPVEYDEAQHLTAAAAQAAAALKASMDQLHRSTEQAGLSCDLAASAPVNTASCTLSTAETSQPTAAAYQHEASGSSRCSDHEHSTCCANDTSPTAPRVLCAGPDPADTPLLQPAAAGAAASALCAAVAAADEQCLLMVETEQAAVAPPQHDQAGLQEGDYGTAAVVRPVAQAAAVPKCSLAQLQLQLQRHRQEQELELESVVSEGMGGSLGQDHAAACSTLPVPPDELLASGLSAAGSQQGSCTEAALGCVAAGAAHVHDAVAADVRHIQDHNTSVDHQQQDTQQQALLRQQQQLRGTEDHLMRPVRHEDATNVRCSRQHALMADGSHAPDTLSGQATPSMPEAVHDLQPAPDGSAAPAAGPSTTLDSLLAEAKQLAALRRAVGAEFAAMGRNRVAAVMGAVGPLTGSSGTTGDGSGSRCGGGSNSQMGCSARCDDTAGRWQSPHPAQQHGTQQPLVTPLQAVPGSSSSSSSTFPADSPHRAATGGRYALQDTAQHTLPPQGPSVCAVGSGQHAHTAEGPVQCLLQHKLQQPQTHQQQQQEQLIEQQQEEEEVEPQHPWPHYEQAQLRQQQKRQQYTPAFHTQQRAVASSRDTMPLPLTAASGIDLTRPAAQLCLTSNPLYQSSPQSPSSASCISLPSHNQQLHLGGEGGSHTARYQQKQLQQQHEQSNQLQQQKLEEEIMLLSVDLQAQLQRGHAQQMHRASHQPIPTQAATGLRLHSKPAAVACAIQQQDSPDCYWQAGSSSQHDATAVTGAHQLQAPVAAGDTVLQQASLSSGHVFDTAAASQGQLAWAGPAVSCQVAQHQWMYPGPPSSCARMVPTAAATAPKAEPHALSQPHNAEAISAGAAPWLVQLPPLCDAGPAGANWTGPVSPSTAAAAAAAGCSLACDGSPERGSSRSSSPQSSHFLSKQASKARSAVFSAVGRFNGYVQHQHLHLTQQQLQMQQQQQQQQQVPAVQAQLPGAAPRSCTIQAEDQGSYVAAALVAQQRAQVEAAERERIRAAAEAAKQAAARRLAAERAEAQRRAAEQAAQHKQPPPVAIGSYARQQAPQQHAQTSAQHQGQQQAQRSPEQCQADFMTQDVDQQLDGYGQENAPAGQHALDRTAAVPPPVLKKASGTREQQQAADGQGKQPVLPQGPAPNRNSSPRRRSVRQGTTTSPAVMAAAAGPPTPKAAAVRCMEPVGVDVPAVLARAVDQYAPVSRIPAAPGSKPSTPGCSGTAGSSSPSHNVAASRGPGAGRQLLPAAAAANMGACQASHADDSEDDDDFAYLERELQEDAMAACQSARPGRVELQQGQTGQGYWSQQQQAQPQQLQHGKVLQQQQQQQQGPQQPAHVSYQSVMSQPPEHHIRADPAGAGKPYPGKGPSSMWAAVHAATGSQAWAGTAAGQYSSGTSWSGDPKHPGSHTAQQPQQLPAAAAELRRAPAAAVPAAARPAGPATRHGIRGTAGAAATQAASASILAAPAGHVPTGAYSAAAAAAAAPAQQQLQHKARVALPQPKHGASRAAPQPSQAPVKPGRKPPQQQQQQQQQSSRLSLEEATLLAELQQLDQRIHQPSHLQQTDAPARSAKLPVLPAAAAAGGGASQLRTRAATARGAATSKSPARQAPTTAPEQRAAAGCNGLKLAAVRGATGSRGSSSSSSGARSDPTAGRLPQQHSRTGKQARLVALPNTVGAAAKAGGAPSLKRPPAGAVTAGGVAAGAAGGVAVGPAGASGPMPSAAVLPPWVMPCMMGQGAAVPGVFPGGCGPQGYWWAPGGQCGYTNPGVAWPEGPAAAGGVGGLSWPSEAAYRAPGQPSNRGEHMGVMMGPRRPAGPAWLGQQPAHGPVPWQQQVWWQGQLQPQDLSHAGHPYSQQLHAGMPYSPGGISQVHGQGSFPCPYPSARSGTPQPHSNHYNGTGPYSMQGPPLTAPSGMREVPGSPLLPTLHYQQTVMRDRTSSRGGAESDSGGEGWQVVYAGQAANSAGTASGPGSRWGSAGSGSSNGGSTRPQQEGVGGAASSWGCRVAQEAADVWPARGLERSVLSGIQAKGGVGRRQDGDGPGEIVVYNDHLLLS